MLNVEGSKSFQVEHPQNRLMIEASKGFSWNRSTLLYSKGVKSFSPQNLPLNNFSSASLSTRLLLLPSHRCLSSRRPTPAVAAPEMKLQPGKYPKVETCSTGKLSRLTKQFQSLDLENLGRAQSGL